MQRFTWVLFTALFCSLSFGAVAPELMVRRSDISQPRRLNDRIRLDLNRLINKHSLKKVLLNTEIGNEEATEFAGEIAQYLKSLSIEVETREIKPRFPVDGIGVAVKGQVAYLTISNRY